MQRCNFALISFFLIPIVHTHYAENSRINRHTNLIYQRFYITKRVKYVIEYLRTNSIQQELLENIELSLFSHTVIQKHVLKMKENKHIAPLYVLWDALVSYQYLYEPLFTEDFVKLLYVLCALKYPYDIQKYPLSYEHCLLLLDNIMDIAYDRKASLGENQIADAITIDHIAKRYFVLKRLHKTISFLNATCKQAWSLIMNKDTRAAMDYTLDIYDNIAQFNHGRIRECLKDLCLRKSLDPMLHIYNECKQYRYIADDTFLQEILMSILLIYKVMLLQNLSKQTEFIIFHEVQQVLDIYECLGDYSLEEALDAVDRVTEKLTMIQNMSIVNTYSINVKLVGALICGFLSAMALYYT